MAKYSIDTTDKVKLEYVETRMLVNIANELAEANRLKRMELKYLGEDVISDKEFKQLCEQVKKLKDEA